MSSAHPLPPDPLGPDGIAAFGRRLRSGATTAEATTAAFLARIEALDGRLGAFEHVAPGMALASARALDAAVAAGIDLGPLMGVPVAVKDLLAVEGMPTTAGSNIDVSDIVGAEGPFVRRLKRAGCVILGKTKTVEFGIGGTTHTRGTPWNPWDPRTHRSAAGSSSGSGVAVAAGMSGFAIGSDSGGSVRLSAAFCGITGLKTTAGRWPLDGVFPLSPTFDTLGLLTCSVEDAALAFAALEGEDAPDALAPAGLRLGRPDLSFENLEPDVAAAVSAAVDRIAAAGAAIEPIHLPEAGETVGRIALISPIELVAGLGRERFLEEREHMHPDIAARAAQGLEVTADDYIGRLRLHRELCHTAAERMEGFDAWVMPTCPVLPPPISAFDDVGTERRFNARLPQNSRPANAFGMCAVSLPLKGPETGLPVGLQVVGRAQAERQVLAVARTLEAVLGTVALPDVSAFSATARDGGVARP